MDIGSQTSWEFDVAVSNHDALKEGITEVAVLRIVVYASEYTEASLIAAQVASRHGMATATYLRI